MPEEHAIQSGAVRQLTKLVEEFTRATGESVKYFIEPTPGVLDKAKNKRHHIIFGRRGSGKSSLLHKVAADLTISRNSHRLRGFGAVQGSQLSGRVD